MRELEAQSPFPREGREGWHLLQHMLSPPSLAEISHNLRFGRQEDAHEFLRYTIDAMQKACLNGYTKYVGPDGPSLLFAVPLLVPCTHGSGLWGEHVPQVSPIVGRF